MIYKERVKALAEEMAKDNELDMSALTGELKKLLYKCAIASISHTSAELHKWMQNYAWTLEGQNEYLINNGLIPSPAEHIKSDKELIVSAVIAEADNNSKDAETAREYLKSEGVDVYKFVAEGLKRIKAAEQDMSKFEKAIKETADKQESFTHDQVTCPDCKGSGFEWNAHYCEKCGGHGVIDAINE